MFRHHGFRTPVPLPSLTHGRSKAVASPASWLGPWVVRWAESVAFRDMPAHQHCFRYFAHL